MRRVLRMSERRRIALVSPRTSCRGKQRRVVAKAAQAPTPPVHLPAPAARLLIWRRRQLIRMAWSSMRCA
jgi:hypothetical protein